MPHYKDGSLAKIGDVVRGTTYNKPGVVVGIISKITPGTESCNAVVTEYIRVIEQDGIRVVLPPDGYDYTETAKLEKVL